MQPFDALSLKTIIEELKPVLLNRKVDKVYQLGRDEAVLTLRGSENVTNLFLSAHAMTGRISLVDARTPRYQQPAKAKGSTAQNHGQSAFSMILRKHLTGATLLAIEFQEGERMADFIFSCVDEVGTRSHKVLTAEIMGRHSNLIFWDKSSEKILAASHVVTEEMSRTREIAAGMRFVRPPTQDKNNIFKVNQEEFTNRFRNDLAIRNSGVDKQKVQKWLTTAFSGIGKNLADEILTGLDEKDASFCSSLYARIMRMQGRGSGFANAMRADLSRYSILGFYPEIENSGLWRGFENTSTMTETYFSEIEERERLRQFREKLKAELSTGIDKLESRKEAAQEQLTKADNPDALKKAGDLILANLHAINPGQEILQCEDFFSTEAGEIEIALDPNLTGTQNSQNYYRLFNKHKIRYAAATAAIQQANERLETLLAQLERVENAPTMTELTALKEHIVEQKPEFKKPPPADARKRNKPKLIQLKSSDGWIIYIGRNRFENDQLLSKLAQPSDVWLHVLGSGGAHVLVKVPASKQNPPMTTLKEAAEVAARMSKASSGAKVRVVYTQIRYVKKLANEKPGVVRYENEKTLEIDTSQPVPQFMRILFPS